MLGQTQQGLVLWHCVVRLQAGGFVSQHLGFIPCKAVGSMFMEDGRDRAQKWPGKVEGIVSLAPAACQGSTVGSFPQGHTLLISFFGQVTQNSAACYSL